MAPKVDFQFSWIYNQHWMQVYPDDEFASEQEIREYISTIRPVWDVVEQDVFTEIARVTNLSWYRKTIPCFVVGVARPFSHPLTVSIREDTEYFIDILVHELIHNILFDGDNNQLTEKYFSNLKRMYPDEESLTRSHLLIHAVHQYIFETVFSPERMQREISRMKQYPAYARSWELVQKIGYKTILNEFYQACNL